LNSGAHRSVVAIGQEQSAGLLGADDIQEALMWQNSRDGYGIPSKLLHWTIALIIFGLIGLGWWMVGLDYYHPRYHSSLNLHKSLGMIALGLVLAKMLWRYVSPYPVLAKSLVGLPRKAATGMHHLLWLAMVLIPLTGYAISTSEGAGVDVFDWFTIPAWLPKNETLRDVVTVMHEWIAYAAGVLALLHAGAAIKHQFVDRDGTLRRMLW
jgi:cytochrome b561